MCRLVIDRIDDGVAVCEVISNTYAGSSFVCGDTGASAAGRLCGTYRYEFSLCELPEGVRVGDVLDYKDNKFTPNPEAARERQIKLRELMDDVFE